MKKKASISMDSTPQEEQQLEDDNPILTEDDVSTSAYEVVQMEANPKKLLSSFRGVGHVVHSRWEQRNTPVKSKVINGISLPGFQWGQ